jgi:hypothetical protein
MFRDPDFCQERCEFDCQLQLYFAGRENEPEEQYYCAKLRPPPKALHEKLIDGFGRAGIFEFIVGGVIIFAVFVCCVCSCYQACFASFYREIFKELIVLSYSPLFLFIK